MIPGQIAERERQFAGPWWRRFLLSVPGQILSDPPAFRMTREMQMQADRISTLSVVKH